MSALLLDTHVFVWLLAGNERLGTQARLVIEQAAEADQLYLSAISPWEIAMLVSKGRLILEQDVGEWMDAALALPGIRLVPLLPNISVASTRLPGSLHADPADRIIVATARHLAASLLTADGLLLNYGEAGYMKVLSAEQ